MQLPNLPFAHLKQVDSTNNYAMGKVHAGMAKHGDAYFTMEQTQGKGQRGRQWLGDEGKNIAISIVIEPPVLAISEQFALSAAVALGTYKFFSSYAGSETSIKWPNDIYWRDRKAAGILIENVIGHQKVRKISKDATVWKYAVVGIGVNINQIDFDSTLVNPVSLKQITGKDFDCIALAKELHLAIFSAVDEVLKGEINSTLKKYNEHLYKKNEMVILKKDNIQFETRIKGVSENGELLTTDIIDNQFEFGQVAWVM